MVEPQRSDADRRAQEKADAALARRLQAEEDALGAPPRVPPPPPAASSKKKKKRPPQPAVWKSTSASGASRQ